MEAEYSLYLGQEQKNGFTGFLSEKNFFCVVEIFDGYTNEQGEQLMSALAGIGTTHFDTLAAFDSAVSELCKNANIPLDTSIAIGYKKNQVLYLKTIGSGEIYLGRGRAFERVIHGAINAAGKYEENDFFVFTTSFFTQSLKGITHTKSLLHKHTSIREFPERIKQEIGAEDDTGAVALFVQMTQHKEVYISGQASGGVKERLIAFIQDKIRLASSLNMKKKIIVGIILLFCIGLFGWNMSRGILERGGLQVGQTQSVSERMQQIESSLEHAAKTDTVGEGLQIVKDAQDSLRILAKTTPKDKQQDLAALQKKAYDTQSSLLKRTVASAKEFYDFAVEEAGATAVRLSLSENKALALNPEGKVYTLTLDKKSPHKLVLPKKASTQSLVAGYEKYTFVLTPGEGVVRLDEEGKGKVVIPQETQWAKIVSMQAFNGNIYLLDGGNGVLYKYPVITDGYGDRASYFKGTYDEIDENSSFAIDISVYVASKDTVTKYTAGIKDDFKLDIPGDAVTITKIITHPDQADLYMWDKPNGTLYIASREGVYSRQIASPQLSQATDVEVYDGKAFLLNGSKLYSIDL